MTFATYNRYEIQSKKRGPVRWHPHPNNLQQVSWPCCDLNSKESVEFAGWLGQRDIRNDCDSTVIPPGSQREGTGPALPDKLVAFTSSDGPLDKTAVSHSPRCSDL